MPSKKIIIRVVIFSSIIIGIFIVGILGYLGVNKYKDKINLEKQEIEDQRKLIESDLEEQKAKIENLESKLIETQKEQSNLVRSSDLPKQALTPSQIINANAKYVVAVACHTQDGIALGSGVIVGSANNGNLIILTNYHVIDGFYASDTNSSCIITPYQKPVHHAKPVYFSNIVSIQEMRSRDWALLEITNLATGAKDSNVYRPTLVLDTFPKLCNASELKLGSEIVILGYPSIGSNTVSGYTVRELIVTEGIISSSPEDWEDDFATSAKIDHGSSGGGGFLKTNGCYAGIPSFGITGEIESLGRLINVPTLNSKFYNFISELQK